MPRSATGALVVLVAFGLAACGGGGDGANGGVTGPGTTPTQTLRVTVDAGRVLRVVDSGLVLGGNLAVWNSPSTLLPPTDSYVVERGASLLRFPGGNLSNNFCWPLMRVSDNDHVVWDDWSWGTGVEDFASFVGRIGGVPLYSLMPFDHTIDGQLHRATDEARDLVRLMRGRGFAGAYYEVGNENDGSWNPMLSPAEYVDAFILLGDTVRREDSSARLLGPVGSGTEAAWRDGFIDGLAARGRLDLLDLFSFHYYGGWISSTNSATINLNDPQHIPAVVQAIRDKLASVGAAEVGVALTEYNAAIWDNTTRGQFTIEQALWLVDAAGELFRTIDLANVWIDLTADGDPHGLLNAGTTPPARTKNYWPMYLVGQTLGFGSRDPAVSVLETTTDQPTSRATAYATLSSDGRLGILVVNKGDPLAVQVSLAGRGCGGVAVLRMDPDAYAAGTGPATQAVTCASGTVSLDMPARSAVGVRVE
jgi:hypothetical protein